MIHNVHPSGLVLITGEEDAEGFFMVETNIPELDGKVAPSRKTSNYHILSSTWKLVDRA